MTEDRRSDTRRNVDLPVDCRIPATACRAMLRNLSSGGCMVETTKPLVRGSTILLSLPAAKETAGMVMWAKGRMAGVKFFASLPSHIVEMVAGSGGYEIEVKAA